MAILFKGEKINEALTQHEESLKNHRTELNEIQATLKEKVDRTLFQAQLEQASATAAQKLDAAVRERDQLVSALQERTAALEARQQEILAALEKKAEVSLLQSREEHLASCISGLERRHEELGTVVDGKAADARAEGHERQLASVEESLAALHRARERLDAEVAAKASNVHLDEQRERLGNLANALQQQGQELKAVLETKASVADHTDLGSSHAGLQSKLAELEKDLEARLGEIDATLAKKVDVAIFNRQADLVKERGEQLDALEQKQASQNDHVHDVLATKADKVEAEDSRNQHSNLSSICAYKSDMVEAIRHLQEQLDACRSQAVGYHEQAMADLATKVAIESFEKRWDQVIVKELRPNIRSQREQLNAALEKKDQLIQLAERMQADLGCALALRGRGPPRLGPLVAAPPTPSPRKAARSLRAATPDGPL